MEASGRRVPRAWTWLRTVAASSVVLAGAACGFEVPTQPNVGFIRIDVVTTGDDRDLDGYLFSLDRGQTTTIGSSSSTGSFYVPSGTHTVTIGSVAPNCSVDGTTTRQAEVTQGQTVIVLFTIACVGTGMHVTTATSGPASPVNFKLTVDQQAPVTVEPNGVRTIGRLRSGTYSVTLAVPEHCTVGGSNPLTVVVVDKGYAEAGFVVVCAMPIRREKIAYVVNGSTIETITPDGSRIDRLGASAYSVAWMRDGTRLAYSDAECGFDYYYYYLGLCRGGVYVTDPELGTVAPIVGAEYGSRPAGSPVRDELVFDREVDFGKDARVPQLFVLATGAPVAQAIALDGSPRMFAATWAPDGERLAYVCTPEANRLELCVVRRDGSGYERLTADAAAKLDPAWSPDGKSIVFTRIGAGTATGGEVALLDVASGAITRLGAGVDPAWSPDGSRIAFASGDGLFLMNADGSNRRRLTTGKHTAPAWRPTR